MLFKQRLKPYNFVTVLCRLNEVKILCGLFHECRSVGNALFKLFPAHSFYYRVGCYSVLFRLDIRTVLDILSTGFDSGCISLSPPVGVRMPLMLFLIWRGVMLCSLLYCSCIALRLLVSSIVFCMLSVIVSAYIITLPFTFTCCATCCLGE